jgi:hypothetical protein
MDLKSSFDQMCIIFSEKDVFKSRSLKNDDAKFDAESFHPLVAEMFSGKVCIKSLESDMKRIYSRNILVNPKRLSVRCTVIH